MQTPASEMPQLELALLRRGMDEIVAEYERCGCCHRTPLIGERMYEYEKLVLCELCRERREDPPTASHVIHGPAFGHTIRIVDQRSA